MFAPCRIVTHLAAGHLQVPSHLVSLIDCCLRLPVASIVTARRTQSRQPHFTSIITTSLLCRRAPTTRNNRTANFHTTCVATKCSLRHGDEKAREYCRPHSLAQPSACLATPHQRICCTTETSLSAKNMARLNTRPSYRSSTAPSSRYPSATPGPGNNSDQENHDPNTTRMEKGKGRARDSAQPRPSLPTPESGGGSVARGQKRKRAEARADDQEGDDDEEAETEAKFNKYFDPNQNVDERRELKKRSRALERGFAGEWGTR